MPLLGDLGSSTLLGRMALAAADVTVLYFGGVKDAVGCARERVRVEPPLLTALYEQLSARHPQLPTVMSGLRLALNEEFLNGMGLSALCAEPALTTGDVVAFIPPVTGG